MPRRVRVERMVWVQSSEGRGGRGEVRGGERGGKEVEEGGEAGGGVGVG